MGWGSRRSKTTLSALVALASGCAELKPGANPTVVSSMISSMGSSGDCPAIAPPTHLASAGAAQNRVELSWWASTTAELKTYLVYRDGRLIANVTPLPASAPLHFIDTGVQPATAYTYSVAAEGLCEMVSAHSQDITVETP